MDSLTLNLISYENQTRYANDPISLGIVLKKIAQYGKNYFIINSKLHPFYFLKNFFVNSSSYPIRARWTTPKLFLISDFLWSFYHLIWIVYKLFNNTKKTGIDFMQTNPNISNQRWISKKGAQNLVKIFKIDF